MEGKHELRHDKLWIFDYFYRFHILQFEGLIPVWLM